MAREDTLLDHGSPDLGEPSSRFALSSPPPGPSEDPPRRPKGLDLSTENLLEIIDTAREIRLTDAAEADAIGYLARILIQTNLPHSDPGPLDVWVRHNGNFTLQITPGRTIATTKDPSRKVGIPYGTYPRLLLSWVTTEALRTRSPELFLGNSFAEFMRRLGLQVTGGAQGTVRRVREQMQRLFSSEIAWSFSEGTANLQAGIKPFEGMATFWHPTAPEQRSIFQSRLLLNHRLFDEILHSSVPLDMRVVHALARLHSCLGLDLYGWLTHKQRYLQQTGKTVFVPWKELQAQFGADYGRTTDFRRRLEKSLRIVKELYPAAGATPNARGLLIRPSRPHVAVKAARKALALPPAADGAGPASGR